MPGNIKCSPILEVRADNLNADWQSVTQKADWNHCRGQIACSCRRHPGDQAPVGALFATYLHDAAGLRL
jgi:hypothetical protein